MNTASEFLNKKIFMSIQEYKNLLGKYNISDHDKLVYKKIVDDKKKFILSWNIEKNSCYKKQKQKISNVIFWVIRDLQKLFLEGLKCL